ncbi:transcription termination factor MTERF15, mitochondrial-like [Syzygium oleosum]|uniref:transcription termination factor MTERF15, mitochondrial-like n=1 Tax=Syzygium oleosum TaxID=219896 RepID=UPI0011D18E1B|nr:transcription termination factor MTERF15, mitochondrial-like [Syzygium oleosum]
MLANLARKALLHARVILALPNAGARTLLRPASTSSESRSFTVSYLVNACGLSPESALSASLRVRFETPSRPDSVLGLLKERGFSPTQISDVVSRYPTVLLASPDKILLPKIEFLRSRGFSDPDLARVISAVPRILARSLEKHLRPTLDYIGDVVQSGENAVAAIKRYPRILYESPGTQLIPKITTLRNNGVPHKNIGHFVLYHGPRFLVSTEQFDEAVDRVKALGFNPSKVGFVTALHVIRCMSESSWRKKIGVYGKWGWSEEDVALAFRRHPWCMAVSESKITKAMDFFVNEMGLDSLHIARRPVVISLSLRKRIVPRCSVFRVLLSKGLVHTHSLATSLIIPERRFLEEFVTRYLGEAPQLLDLYKEKMGLAN